MLNILGGVFGYFTGWFARFLGIASARALIYKSLIYVIVVSVLPIVLYNLFNTILAELLSYAANNFSASPIAVQFTGFSGWLAIQLKLPETFSVIMSAFIARVTIAFIPFLNRI